MELKEAITILENHNEWRRSNEVPNNIVMVDPKELGIAIEVIVSEFKKLTMPAVKESICVQTGLECGFPCHGGCPLYDNLKLR